MIALLVWILVAIVVLYVVKLLVDYMELPQPIRTVVLLVVGLIFLLWLLSQLGLFGPRVVVW